MRDIQVQHGDLGITKLLFAFAVLSVIFLGLLAVAPARSQFTEWRAAIERYNVLAAEAGESAIEVRIQQIWKPDLGITDRCTSCHVGMGPEPAVPGDPLYRDHPDVHHDPADLGCTICHGGQGRATTVADAHGDVANWDDPILDPRYLEAGCGSCHTHLRAPAGEITVRGETLFRRYDCGSCHAVDGTGGREADRTGAPDLTLAGWTGFDHAWSVRHLLRHQLTTEGPWATNYGDVSREDAAPIDEYLLSRFGGSRLPAAKALAHRLGCRGCHQVNGVGGTDGPDLTEIGRRVLSHEFDATRGDLSPYDWLRSFLRNPGQARPGSRMPTFGLTDEQIDLLTLYLLSLRPVEVPARFSPPDRFRAENLGERDFATDGESLYGVFCAACHGPGGSGRTLPGIESAFPAVGNRAFLAIASNEFLRRTLSEGRPGRRMPAFGQGESGLQSDEMDAIIAYLRAIQPEVPERRAEWALAGGDAERGRTLYVDNGCDMCHGEAGVGLTAPALANPAFLAAATDDFLAATIALGRDGTDMPSFADITGLPADQQRSEIADIVAYLRTLRPAGTPGGGAGGVR